MTTEITKPEPVRLLDPRTGELVELNIQEASTEQLAATAVEVVEEQVGYLATVAGAIESELLRRLDKAGSWTKRVGDPESGVQYEIKAPSPTAGTVSYDLQALRSGLVELLEQDEIDEEAAAAALVRTISIVAQVPTGTDLGLLVEKVSGVTEIAGIRVRDPKVEKSEKVAKAGIQRLEKMGGDAAALVEKAKTVLPAGFRRVKIATKRKD